MTKLRASNGTLLGTFAVGDGPRAVIFDGTSIWVANTNSSNVTKLNAAGVTLGAFAVAAGS